MYNTLADSQTIQKTMEALKQNGFNPILVNSGADAKNKILELIPKGAEIFTATSATLDAVGLNQELNESGNYNSVKAKLNSMDRNTQGLEMRKLGAASDYAIGSVHAVTQDGKVLVASLTGSQLPNYAYGAMHLFWVVGAQKIVKDLEDGMKRIYEYVLPLESERAKKAYGVAGSSVHKLLIFNKELPNRITIILVNEALGF